MYNGKGRKTHNTEQYNQITVVTFRHQDTSKHEIIKMREMNSNNKMEMSLVGRFQSVIFSHSMAIVVKYSMIKSVSIAQIVVNVLWFTTKASWFDYHPSLGTFKLIICIKVYPRLTGGCWVSLDTSPTNIYNLPL